MSATHFPSAATDTSQSWLSRLLPYWLLLAALGQLLYLAHWPMYLLYRPVPFWIAVAVALVRLGVYTALGWGLLTRDRTAWAGAIVEIARSFACFVALLFLANENRLSPLYPAAWAQGVLVAGLPLLLCVHAALSFGWRPDRSLEMHLATSARMLSALFLLSALSLRHEHHRFDIAPQGHWRLLLKLGLPAALIVGTAEAIAFVLSGLPPGN